MIDLSGKSAVVTGGSRGIGRAIALRLAQQGADVALQLPGQAAAAAERRGGHRGARAGEALAVQADVADQASASALIEAALGGLRAHRHPGQQRGHHPRRPHHAHEPEDWTDVIDTNLSGAFYATKAVTRPMLKARSGPHHQHHQRLRAGRPDGPGELLVGQGGAHRPDQGHGARAGQPRHHLQRRGARASSRRS